MKTLLTTTLLFLFSFAVFSQGLIKESDLPTEVLKNFKEKFKPAGKAVWTKVKDVYIATYTVGDQSQKMKTSYSLDGAWIDTKKIVNSSDLPPAITNYVKANFKATRIIESSIRKTESDSNYYYILIKKENIDDLASLYFDQKGSLIIKNIPESFNESGKGPAELHVPSTIVSAFKKKYSKSTIKSWTLDTNYYTCAFSLDDQNGIATFSDSSVWVCTKYTVPNKELPSPVVAYVKQNYPDYKIKICELVKEPDVADYYFVYAKIEGIKQPYVNIWFTLSGKFIKRYPPVQNEIASESSIKKERSDDDTYSIEKVDTKELPSPISSYIKKQYPDYFIKDAVLSHTSDGTFYIVKLKQEGQKAITELTFDTKGKYIPSKENENNSEGDDTNDKSTKTKKKDKDTDNTDVSTSNDDSNTSGNDEKVSTKELPTTITNYIKKEYKGSSIKSAVKSTKDEGTFYIVKIKEESKKTLTELTFDIQGNFVEEK